ncbi:olfactory receptor 1G1-like [Spea bombifrons]|uniref:olfactory receptor 1G1-like n=1 Tax=Spea bombifrons TaxID=233779 RepID=UPI0023496A39|nr:olfactory receptor 1G1-like [Spea bombifrons]
MGNLTKVTTFFLTRVSDYPQILYTLFSFFLIIYSMTVILNVLIIFLAMWDPKLHTPMYFFLGNLAFLDISFSSVTAPRMIYDLITTENVISFPACMTQVFFFIYLPTCELFLLAAMSYDRYVAVCHPLHYTQIMSWKVCAQLVSVIWTFSLLYSLIHSLCTLRLTFCNYNTIHNFLCDLPHLFQISCTDTYMNVLVILILGGGLGILAFSITFLPYMRIFLALIRIKTNYGKRKAFSTCTSHLAVVFLFYGSIVFIYFVPSTSDMFTVNKVVSVNYAIINPLLNPLIYSVRNQDLKAALRRFLSYRSF